MSRAGDGGLELLSSDDDLIEIDDPSASNILEDAIESLILPLPNQQHQPAQDRPSRRRRIQPPAPRRQDHQQQQRPSDAVIDLTEEPDSPVQVRPPPVPRQHRNPRRTNSLRITPPRLSRSESVVMTPSFIDLTGDDDQEPERPRRSLRNNYQPNLGTHDHDRLIQVDIEAFRRNTHSIFGSSTWARGLQRTLADFLGTDMIQGGGGDSFREAEFQPRQDTFRRREPSPKPPMDPVTPAKPGFTRDTCAEGDTNVIICPACKEELAYEPGETVVTTSSGKKRRKGEHHFWALKKCGHVSIVTKFIHSIHSCQEFLLTNDKRFIAQSVLRTGDQQSLRLKA